MNIRTTKPSNNKYFIRISSGGYNGAIQGKPTDKTANVLSNCVGYANGRFNEIIGAGKCKYQLTCNAENFIERAKDLGLKWQKKPCKGGVMVWMKGKSLSGSDGAGHVAICEKDESEMGEGKIYTSESAYGGTAFYNATRSNANGRWGMGSAYTFRGCIVNPAVKVTPVADKKANIKKAQKAINQFTGLSIKVDGVVGSETKKGYVKAIQTALNKDYNAKLKVDGLMGSKTLNVLGSHYVRQGEKQYLVTAAEIGLALLDYYSGAIETKGIFGSGLKKAVQNFQKANGLHVDGVCGFNTFKMILKKLGVIK